MTSDGARSATSETVAGQAPAASSTPATAAEQPPAPTSATARPEPVAVPPSPAPVPQQSSQQSPMSEQVYVKPKKGPVRRFVRSLISHLVFALIMVAAAFGWVYHEQIFNRLGDELCTADRLGGYMTKAKAPQSSAPPVKLERATAAPEPAARAASEPPASSPASVPAATAAQPPAPASPPATPAAPAPADTATAAAPSPPSPSPAPVAAATPAPAPILAEAKTAEARPADAAMPRPAEPSKPAMTSSAAAEPPPAPTVTATREGPVETAPAAQAASPAPAPAPEAPSLQMLMSEWQAARQAYAADKAKSVEAYRRLVARHPQVVALRGELGNVYYALGQMKEAVEQYYEAALLHLKGPEPGLAACLVEVIRPFDAERAKSLEEKAAGHPCPRGQSGSSPAKL